MATAQMPAGRSRLADDAATAALYVTHPERRASTRSTANTFARTPNLSHASAASALAHANRKPVEVWQPPTRMPAAEKAALCVKDFTPPQQPQPSTQYSAEGLGAALLAVREHRAAAQAPAPVHKRGSSVDRYNHIAVGGHPKEKALQAATGAYTTSRKRADSVPSDQGVSSDTSYALSAAGASRHARVAEDAPLDHLDGAMEASRIHHIANTNAKLYTAAPPVQPEVDEQNYRNSLRAAAISMAKDMYKVTDAKESGGSDPALVAAQKGQSQLGYRKTVSTADGSAVRRAIALQDAAQKRAAEKLARMQDENAEYQQYYGTAPQAQRSRLSRRKRTSSDADASQIDAEQSRQIRNQMAGLRTKLNRVDDRRTKDREMLMQAARRNVDQTLQDMEARVYANTGRAPPSVQKGWDEVAQERVRREAEAFESATQQGDRVKIGSQQYMDYADIEAVARSRLQPALDEITENAEQQRAHDVEVRLDAEERQRHAAVERQREAELRELEKQDKDTPKNKSESKVTIPKFFLWRMKGKRARVEQSEAKEAQAVSPVTQEPAEEQALAASNNISKDVIPEEASSDVEVAGAGPVAVVPSAATEPHEPTKEATQEPIQEPTPEPTQEPNQEPLHVPTLESAPAQESTQPSELDDIPPAVPRRRSAPLNNAQRDTPIHYFTPPVNSPRADSKLKSWFRDRLVRRSSGPIPVYPHQPGPDFTDSEPAFTGGAALTGPEEPRGAALSSHPFNGIEIPTHNRSSSYYSNDFDVTKTRSGESGAGSSKGRKRDRLRRTFLRRVSRSDDEPMANAEESRRDSEVQSVKTDGPSVQNSAPEQGLPAPPAVGDTMTTRRESKFSEDL